MKKTLLTLYLILIGLAVVAQVPQLEREALIDFYEATNGPKWNQSWDLSTAVTEWSGVTVENNSVTGISMFFNNVQGTLPASLGELSNLKVLELSFNKLEGELPASLGRLNQLEVLAFNGNNLSGEIPVSLGRLKNLKQLHLSSNRLSGHLPESFKNLHSLEVLNVFDNNLNGAIPSDIAKNKSLKQVVIAENNFSNPETFSVVLMSNSGMLDLNKENLTPSANTIIAIESEDEN